MSHERKIPPQLRVWFFPAVPPRYALRFPPIPMRVLTQWIQWLLKRASFPPVKSCQSIFFPICFVSKVFQPIFSPRKILWEKDAVEIFVSLLCFRATPQEYFNAMQVGMDGREQRRAGACRHFFKNLSGKPLFHFFTWHMEVQSYEIHKIYIFHPNFKQASKTFTRFFLFLVSFDIRNWWLLF